MSIVRALTKFSHGKTKFAPGAHYRVPEKLAGYFIGCGWAEAASADVPAASIVDVSEAELSSEPRPPAPAGEETRLEIHNGDSAGEAPKA